MAPPSRPLLRFAVGTTLLVPALGCTNAGGERPPEINTPAPESPEDGDPKPAEGGESAAPESPAKEEPIAINTPAPEGSDEPTPAPEGSDEPTPERVDPPRTNTPRPKPEPTRPPRINTPKPDPEL
ncbi:MAG: hypothetical protein H6711_31115 [Myxococcales bacterium]|nr:hypothetical protein [Myxococcales bacterium]